MEGGLRSWYAKHKDFERYGMDIITTVRIYFILDWLVRSPITLQ